VPNFYGLFASRYNLPTYDVLGSFFLYQEDIRLLGMEAIWNFAKGTGLL